MVWNRRGAAISGGFTACCAVALFALDLLFPQLILPFGWALVLFCGSVFGAAAFAYALRAVLWLPMPHLRARLVPERAKDDHGPINTTRRGSLKGDTVAGQIDQAARDRFLEPIAWLPLIVPEISDTGGPNIVSCEGGGRSFCFDAAAREVWFAVSRKGGIRTLRLSLPNKAQDAYVVTLWWDDEKQYHGLGLNGEVVTFEEPAE